MSEINLARNYRVDVETSPGVWSQLLGLTNWLPKVAPVTEEANTYEDDGNTRVAKTMQSWSAEATVLRVKDGDGNFPPAQEACRLAEDKFGTDAEVNIRWYDKSGGDDAWSGTALVGWERANSGVKDLDAAKISFQGQGGKTEIENPGSPGEEVPVLAAISPTTGGTAGGTLVTITGVGFVGVTAVQFDNVDVTQYSVISPTKIVVVAPADSAGTVAVTVTNGAGESSGKNYVYA